MIPRHGDEERPAFALTGWIALAVLYLVALVAALTGLSVLMIWRLGFGAASITAAPARL